MSIETGNILRVVSNPGSEPETGSYTIRYMPDDAHSLKDVHLYKYSAGIQNDFIGAAVFGDKITVEHSDDSISEVSISGTTVFKSTQDDFWPNRQYNMKTDPANPVITIRPLKPEDSISDVTEVLHQSFASLIKEGFNYLAASQSDEETRHRVDKGQCFVAVADNRIIGSMVYERPHSRTHDCAYYDQNNVSTLHQLGVLPAFQKHGIGRKLVDRAESEARNDGAQGLALDTSEGASKLVDWYQRQGYEPVDTVQWSGKNFRCVVMNKPLTQPS